MPQLDFNLAFFRIIEGFEFRRQSEKTKVSKYKIQAIASKFLEFLSSPPVL